MDAPAIGAQSNRAVSRASSGLEVEDIANPVDADLTRVDFGFRVARNLLDLQGTEVKIGRAFRASGKINFRQGRNPFDQGLIPRAGVGFVGGNRGRVFFGIAPGGGRIMKGTVMHAPAFGAPTKRTFAQLMGSPP